MADLDEDINKTTAPGGGDVDLSDEIQDFRFLGSFSSSKDHTLPRRGEKDFESHGTTAQQDVLAASREAMHNALSGKRIHTSKSLIIGVLDPESGMTTINAPKGPLFKTIGRPGRHGQFHLLPEEALYLLERGNLDVRLPTTEKDEEIGLEGLPLSLQTAYALLVGKLGLSLERYTVYSGLKRAGYIVHRAPTWYPEDFDKDVIAQRSEGVFQKLFAFLFASEDPKCPPLGPVVEPGLYRNYSKTHRGVVPEDKLMLAGAIYRSLSIIPFHDPSLPRARERGDPSETVHSDDDPPLRCSYHVWKPNSPFKISAPGVPDFRICVINARETDVPDLTQLDGLLQSVPYAPPSSDIDQQLYQKLKHGWRNVILAIVDQGVASYIRISDAGFGKERIYETSARGRGNKRAGFGGRGRGRGRGRGQ